MARIDKLETQVRENTNYVQRQRRKVDIVGHLNKQICETSNFSEYIKNIKIEKQALTDYLASYPISGLTNIIIVIFNTPPDTSSRQHPPTDQHSIPVRCFIRKKNAFYIKDEGTWYEMDDDYELTILINSIQVSLLILFERQVREKEKAGKNIMQTYFEQKQKILCNGLSCETIAKKIKRTLYDTFKEELV